jgi:hypothetical protein
MTDPRPENDIEFAERLARSGELAMEIPASALAALRGFSPAPDTHSFIREGVVDGQSVPISVFPRRVAPEGPVDERLLDVDTPEYRANRVNMRDGAEMWEVLGDGTQRLFALLRRVEWIPLG